MRRLLVPAAFILPLLTACGPVNRGLSSVNQPVVSRTDSALDLRLAGPLLAAGEEQRLADWFRTQRLGYGDRISVDGVDVPRPVREAVAEAAAVYGLLLSEVALAGDQPVPDGRVRVILARTTAFVPGCPNWRTYSQPEFSASTMSNYGCAINTNLAAMVADPRDLIEGAEAGTTGDPRTTQRAIEAYRTQEATGKAGLPGGVTSVSVAKGAK